jgi:lysophospholipase L1-like esterase
MGAGVEEQDRYSDRLERMLNADGARRYEVLNAGLSGINTDAVVQRLERVGRGYMPRLFVYGFSTNDIEGPSYESLAGGASPAEVAAFYWAWVGRVERSRSYFLRFLSFRLLAWSASSAAAAREIHHNFFENPAARAAFLRGLDRFAALVRQRSACGLVLIHSELAALDETHPALDIYALVEDEARKRGLGVIQSFPYFEGRDPAPLWVNLFDPHPNAAGHEILARALYDGLMALPKSCLELPPAPARRRASAT